MPETKPIPLRLSESDLARLDACASKLGTNRAAIMRYLVATWLDYFEKHGKTILPPDWREILAAQDGRTTQSRRQPDCYLAITPAHPLALNEASNSTTPDELKKAVAAAEQVVAPSSPKPAAASPSTQTPEPSPAVSHHSTPRLPARSKRRQKRH